MHFTRTHLNGNPYLGIYALANESHVLVPPRVPKRTLRQLADGLEARPHRTTVAGTDLLGTFAVSNSNGMLLPSDATEIEVQELRDALGMNVGTMETKFNALGNLILANDKGAVVGKLYSAEECEQISSVLNVDVKPGTLAHLNIVGSLGRANGSGALVSPGATDDEIEVVKETLDVVVERGTANLGVGNVGTCILVNSKGLAAGMPTTGIEMGKMQHIFEADAW